MGGEAVIIGFKESAFDQYRQWAKKDKNVFKKLDSIITDIIYARPFPRNRQAGTATRKPHRLLESPHY